jgi:hypothetical protein
MGSILDKPNLYFMAKMILNTFSPGCTDELGVSVSKALIGLSRYREMNLVWEDELSKFVFSLMDCSISKPIIKTKMPAQILVVDILFFKNSIVTVAEKKVRNPVFDIVKKEKLSMYIAGNIVRQNFFLLK